MEAILSQVDDETGELTGDLEELESLQISFNNKIEGILLASKNYDLSAKALDDEMKRLKARRDQYIAKRDRAIEFVKAKLNGQCFNSPRVKVTYSKAISTEIDNDFVDWAISAGRDDLLKVAKPTADKTAIKLAIKAGEEIPHAWFESGKIQVK